MSEPDELSSDNLQGGNREEEDVVEVDAAIVKVLTEKQLAEVQTAVDVFGMDVVKS